MDVTPSDVRRITVVVGSGKKVMRSILDIVDELRDTSVEKVTLGERVAGDEKPVVNCVLVVNIVTKKIGVELGSKKSEKERVRVGELCCVLALEGENAEELNDTGAVEAIESTEVNMVDVGAINISENVETEGESSGVNTERLIGIEVEIIETDGVNILTERVSSDEDIGISRETDCDDETTMVDDTVGSIVNTASLEDMKKNGMVELDSGMGNVVAVTVNSPLVCGRELEGVGNREPNVVAVTVNSPLVCGRELEGVGNREPNMVAVTVNSPLVCCRELEGVGNREPNVVAVTVNSPLVCGRELEGVGNRETNVVFKLGEGNEVVTSTLEITELLDDNVKLGVGDRVERKAEDGNEEVVDTAMELDGRVVTVVSLELSEVVRVVPVTPELIVLDEVLIVVLMMALDDTTMLLESITSMLEGMLKENVLVGVGVITISIIVVTLSKFKKLLITN